MRIALVAMVSLTMSAGAGIAQGTGGGRSRPVAPMNDVAERYVKLVLALGQHDKDYVDAYYGPPEWKQQAEAGKVPLADLGGQARALLNTVSSLPEPGAEMEQLRHQYLQRQLSALAARVRMLEGER